MSYVILNAKWESSYDVRIETKGKKATCQLTYYGVISNSTGEDWNNVGKTHESG